MMMMIIMIMIIIIIIMRMMMMMIMIIIITTTTTTIIMIMKIMMMMMIMMIIIIIITTTTILIIIIIEIFLQSPHCAANCLQRLPSSGPGAVVCKSRATHRALITCNMCCVPLGMKGQLIAEVFIIYSQQEEERRTGYFDINLFWF